ncbi:MAG: hypothetical protein ACRERC_06540, partial [Candidatus Binatia bacterium]
MSESPVAGREALCLVASYSHLAGVLAVVRSVRRHWRVQPRIYVALLDHHERLRPGFETLDEVVFVDAAALDIPHFWWVAAKFTALELACAAKPYLIRHALGRGHDCVWYSDSDLLFFAEPGEMRAALAGHDMVVTPHLFTAFPVDDGWRQPTIGNVTLAGLVNAGLFALRAAPDIERFLDEWAAQVVAPGSWLRDVGHATDQHLFNWALVSVPRLAICRDRRTNIAYWNLHERPLRWSKLDGGADDEWTLEGAPIVCFHFSGYVPGTGRLSEFDQRQDLRTNVNLERLCAHYDDVVRDAHQADYGEPTYGYGRVGDLPLSPALRRELKHAERAGPLALTAWPDAPTALMRHALRQPGSHTAMPRVLDEIYRERRDIAEHCHEVRVFPRPFLVWMLDRLRIEYPTFPVIEAGLGFAFHRDALDHLTETIGNMLGVDHARIGRLLRENRSLLLEMMRAADIDPNLQGLVVHGHYAIPAFDPAVFLRYFVSLNPSLERRYDLCDPAAFAPLRDAVVAAMGDAVVAVEGLVEQVQGLDLERSLARVFAYIVRHSAVSAMVRERGLDAEILAHLAPHCGDALGFAATDLVLVDWWLRACRGEHDVAGVGEAPAEPTPPAPERGWKGLRQRVAGRDPEPELRLGATCASTGAGLVARLSRCVVIDESVPAKFADYLDRWWADAPPRR